MWIVDLSITLDDERWAPRILRNSVKHTSHRRNLLIAFLGFGLLPRHLRSGLSWANDTIRLSTHGTTHVDAPWHYAPTSEGKPARTIDDLPLEWFYGDGVVLDMRHRGDGEAITAADVERELERIGYAIKPMDIVLIRTGNDRYLGTRDYLGKGCGMSAEATRFILDRGVRVTGIDSWGWDLPLKTLARKAKASGRKDLFWEAHYVGIDKEYCHIERLAGLDRLPPFGFKVCAFPLKVKDGSAGPARVVALLADDETGGEVGETK